MPANGLPLLLRSFGLTTMAAMWDQSLAQAEHENWGYERLMRQLCESEAQDRQERRSARLLKAARFPDGKTLGNLNEKLLPAKIRRMLPSLLEGHFVDRAENILAFGLPGRGKTHFLAALGRELILRRDFPVLFTPTFKLVQQLLTAKKELRNSTSTFGTMGRSRDGRWDGCKIKIPRFYRPWDDGTAKIPQSPPPPPHEH